MRLNFALLDSGGGKAVKPPPIVDAHRSYCTEAETPEVKHLKHRRENGVFHRTPSAYAGETHATPETPKKYLSEIEREDFEERAAIMEYDGGLSRAEAERLALEAIW